MQLFHGPANKSQKTPEQRAVEQTKAHELNVDAAKDAIQKAMERAVAARHGAILPKEMSEADLIADACQRIDDFLKMIAARPINKDIPQQTLALLASGMARNQ